VGASLVSGLSSMTPSVRPAGIRLLLGRTDWTRSLLNGLDEGRVQLSELSLEQKLALSNHVDKSIADRFKPMLAKGGGLPNPDRQKVVDELMPITELTGDAVAGKAVFKKTCVKCHTHSGEGTRIGPDLTGMAVHPKKELLIHIIDPSRSVEGNFRIYTVQTDDGKVYNGLLASESRTAIELIDSEAKKHQILRENIEELLGSAKSLMPEGFEKQHTKQELTDLLEFLTQRGKFLPIPIDKVATVVTTRAMFHEGTHDEQKLIFPDWTPKVFDGIPFVLIDPQGDRIPNAIMLHGTNGDKPPRMPKAVSLPCNAPAKLIHFLGGISGWGSPAAPAGTPSVTIRLKYADGQTEDHVTRNGEVWADYITRVDVPGSKFAYRLRGQQIRYFNITPRRPDKIESIDLVKGNDATSPIIMAVTIEGP
jgi:putative heme-binding domain-containing protein